MIERSSGTDPPTVVGGPARCNGEDPELFFPMGARARRGTDANAKAVCTGAPSTGVPEWSLVTAQDAGVWGGLDEDERREIRRQRRRNAA